MIKNALQSIMDNLPRTILCSLLSRKTEEAGHKLPPRAIDDFAEHILLRKEGDFIWDDKKSNFNRSIKIAITKEEVETAIECALEALPNVTVKTLDVISKRLFKSLCGRWPSEHIMQIEESENFKNRMEQRWGDGLNYLRILLTCCREIGAETLKRHNKSKSKRHMYRRWVLVRLHARACQVTDEIICLMENGFADGAMARWRTLHELSVVASLIAEGDEDLAERYIIHDGVELKRQADDYDAHQVPLGFSPIGKRRRASIERQYKSAIERFGPAFAHPYGWAADHLGLKKPTFKELQIAAGHTSMSSHYKMASFNVHAGARSLFFNLSSMGDQDIVLAGRSNAGLVDPGDRTAQSLTLITSLYLGETVDLDRLTELNCILHVRDAVAPAFVKAEKQLLRDEEDMQKKFISKLARNGNQNRPHAKEVKPV